MVTIKLYTFVIYLQDVFILDTQKELFVWIGNDTTHDERKNAMMYAHVSMKYFMY